ncbi:MAG: hypothetical protein ACTHO8_02410 [Solirubrobacterales bacterium]
MQPNVEGAELIAAKHLFAGYLSRFVFHATADLSGAEIALQGIGPKLGPKGWTDLARAPSQTDGENVFYLRLPAGTHKLRINFYAGQPDAYGRTSITQGLPYEEFTVRRATGRHVTGARDDGKYSSHSESPVDRSQASFEIAGEGKVLRKLRVAVPVSCQDPSVSLTTATAALRFAKVAPDGTVTGRMLGRGRAPAYVTLDGHLQHRHFRGTVTTAFSSCRGSREFTATLDGT